MGRHDYHFVSHWRVPGTVEEVSAILRKGYDLPRWWPAVYLDAQEVRPGDSQGLGMVVDLYSKAALPYTIRWRSEAVEVRHPYGYTIETSGDFVGRGSWFFEQDGDWVNITYDWRIRADKPLLRYGALLFKRLYAFNHHWAMNKGEESLRLELARRRAQTAEERARIPPPPGPAPGPSLPLALKTLGLAGSGAGVLSLAASAFGHIAGRRGRSAKTLALVAGAGAGAGYALKRAYTRKPRSARAKVPPYLRGYPVVGVLPDFLRDPPRYVAEASDRYGNIVGLQLGPLRAYVLTHPAYARHVLEDNAGNYEKDPLTKSTGILLGEGVVVVDGELWRRKRHLIQPVYEPEHTSAFATTVATTVVTMRDHWLGVEERGEPIDLAAEMQRLMMELAIKVVFGSDEVATSRAEALNEALSALGVWFDTRSKQAVQLPPSLPSPGNRRMHKALGVVDALVYAAIAERRKPGYRGHDLVSMLLSLRDSGTGEPISEREARDEAVTALVSMNQQQPTLTWILYALAKHTEAADTISTELKTLLGGDVPSLSDLPRLTCTSRFIQEAMRLYPAAWSVMRTALADDWLDGYSIPAKSLVIINSYGIHHHPSFWPNPYQFDPQRFSPERSAGRPAYAYQPFGLGERTCLGRHLVMATNRLVVSTLAQQFKLHLLPECRVEPVMVNGLLQPRHGVVVRLERQ